MGRRRGRVRLRPGGAAIIVGLVVGCRWGAPPHTLRPLAVYPNARNATPSDADIQLRYDVLARRIGRGVDPPRSGAAERSLACERSR